MTTTATSILLGDELPATAHTIAVGGEVRLAVRTRSVELHGVAARPMSERELVERSLEAVHGEASNASRRTHGVAVVPLALVRTVAFLILWLKVHPATSNTLAQL